MSLSESLKTATLPAAVDRYVLELQIAKYSLNSFDTYRCRLTLLAD